MLTEVDIEARIEAGRSAAESAAAHGPVEHKPFGQTSPVIYPYTYWYVYGYNQYVDEVNGTGGSEE
ncbi:hypothetical protein SEA_LITTLELAF_94 [Mycobacterium phage LittleLaf]|uniref:Uncharacterized protein n=2 Tax=Marvinvirus marvin TaxID=1982092 RepID=A0A385UEI4_9CAUD|nr:hypothetical protein SEA_LITTLELAF_94 [Mycobacterium phage LittleLaf]QFP97646.1 hypothetical protein SEA_CORAZON_91 [Mycobacterium phage Corazon]URP22589.1 hypothetical protein SEA_HUPHLEPUFF_98 [Mycobacterium phage Huphlepuff]WAA20201.1 hypothetical protein SEA_CLARKSON_97 [Mycobacterium phage Clarkson]